MERGGGFNSSKGHARSHREKMAGSERYRSDSCHSVPSNRQTVKPSNRQTASPKSCPKRLAPLDLKCALNGLRVCQKPRDPRSFGGSFD